jgi:YHS domain-containing protein
MPAKRKKTKDLVMDPRCGRSVDPAKALRMTWEGKDYYFCCEACRRAFYDDPTGVVGF